MITFDENNKNLAGLQWVARAICRDKLNARPSLVGVIHVKDNKAIGTDRQRMHIADVNDIPDGHYQVIKNNKTLMLLEPVGDIDYPDVGSVFWPIEKASLNRIVYVNGNNRWGQYITFVRDVAPINGDYFFDLVEGQGEFTAYIKRAVFDPVYFKGDNKQGFIMPINV